MPILTGRLDAAIELQWPGRLRQSHSLAAYQEWSPWSDRRFAVGVVVRRTWGECVDEPREAQDSVHPNVHVMDGTTTLLAPIPSRPDSFNDIGRATGPLGRENLASVE
jgi:hypothetical protein